MYILKFQKKNLVLFNFIKLKNNLVKRFQYLQVMNFPMKSAIPVVCFAGGTFYSNNYQKVKKEAKAHSFYFPTGNTIPYLAFAKVEWFWEIDFFIQSQTFTKFILLLQTNCSFYPKILCRNTDFDYTIYINLSHP